MLTLTQQSTLKFFLCKMDSVDQFKIKQKVQELKFLPALRNQEHHTTRAKRGKTDKVTSRYMVWSCF